ncbi:type II toxin-antitoxin system RelE/ParE family toxin [Rhizobium sp. C1]|uniref:type II toxin-antitoxin system RelE/ParE family toxin n=1 Tax=Rhizobium sp. C1 TaxID=1349799 RepID=UPI001E569A34|nr:type II toxin-antitoxin system RelE/ParE family toxin [Rhizobium sp. C1]MCD2176697.1 type II toxin-antitoxin system RelE/ParE family toxin [Rhizobium sp. C1]
MKASYILTEAAEADLRAIIRYTRREWSDPQVRRYVEDLELGIARLALAQGSWRDVGSLYPHMRVAHVGHHYVFCLPQDNAPALIVAILHERMDLMARLAERLKG